MSARRHGPLRRGTQLAVAGLYLALPLLNAHGHRGALGTLASTRAGPVELLEPASALSAALAAFAAGAAAPLGSLLVAAAPPLALALVLGPVFCSWLCPFGLLSEGLDAVRARLRPRAWPAEAPGGTRRIRGVGLAVVLGASALLALPVAAILQGPRAVTAPALEAAYLGAVSPFAAGLLAALLALDALLPRRLFCRALCPAGAVATLLRTRRTLRVAFDPGACRCAEGAPCHQACPWGVDPRAARPDGCTNCLACLDVCPTGALEAGFRPPG